MGTVSYANLSSKVHGVSLHFDFSLLSHSVLLFGIGGHTVCLLQGVDPEVLCEVVCSNFVMPLYLMLLQQGETQEQRWPSGDSVLIDPAVSCR